MKHITFCSSKRIFSALASVLFVATMGEAQAVNGGIAGRTGANGGPTCATAACHAAGAAVPTVAINGPASVAAGSTTTYTVTVTGGPAVNAGVDVAAPGATLAVSDATITKALTRAGAVEIVHSAPLAFAAGATSASFPFSFTAPAMPGTVTIFAAGLSGDGAGDDVADGTGLATLAVTVAAGGGANQAPVAVIAGPTSGSAGTAVTFDANGSTDADGTIASYAWTFSDGTTATGVTTSKTFTAAGTFTIGLTVTDNAGATGTASASINVAAAGTPIAPTAAPGGPYTGTVGTAVQFNGTASTDPDGTIAAYAWDFGDGPPAGTGTGASPTYTYTAAGTYTVTLTVTDNTNATGTATATATITAPAPGTPPAATTGEQLYVANCESCHGPGGVGGPNGDVVGESAEDIAEAIVEVPTMADLATLTPEEIQAIADFLNPPPPAASVAAGETLYAANCESCHGAGGVGGASGDVVGESAEDITEAIAEVPTMADLSTLTPEEIQSIADYLASVAPAGGPTANNGGGTTGGGQRPNTSGSATQSGKTSSDGGSMDALILSALMMLSAAAIRRRR